MFKKFKVKKDSSRVVLHKLTNVVIKKNSKVEKEHIITKIKKHEKFYTICLSCAFVLIFIGVALVFGTSFRYFKNMNSYSSGDVIVEYAPSSNGIGDVISLTDSDITEDGKVKNNETYKFTVTNNGLKKVAYKISIRYDNDIVDLDGCGKNIFEDNLVKYNINKGNVFTLENKKDNNKYILVEDIVPARSTRIYSMNVWIDREAKLEGKHFHGVIEVDVE